ncbi:MAG: AI-2E family transporter [Bernardetiaceae bacterium]
MKHPLLQILLPLTAFLGLAWYFSDIFAYFLIAFVLTAILRTPTNYINQNYIFGYKIPRLLAILIAFAILVLIIALFIILFIPLVRDQINVISTIDYDELFAQLSQPITRIENFLFERGLILQKGFSFNLRDYLTDFFGENSLKQIINQVLSTTGNVFVGSIAVIFITFFLLYEKGILRKRLIALTPNKYFEVSITAFYKIERLLSNYLLGLLLQMLSIFTIAAIGLKIVGIDYAITIAIFAALANLIPYVGPILGASFGIMVSLSTEFAFRSEQYLLVLVKVGIVFLVVQLVDNLILQPVIFSKSVKAHPLEIFLVVFIGAAIGGAVGMILAIPTYTIGRVSVHEFYVGYKQYRVFR